MAVDIKQLAVCVTCHAYNADRTKLAFCPNNKEVHIWAKSGNEFVPEAILSEHDQVVTGIDWSPKTNRIVSCSQDRNAYVWTFEGGNWKPVLVILRLNRAATSVKWSPNGDKFAVSSGAKCVSVCYFEEEQNWWVSKHIRKHKSTVTSLDWHPNNVLLVTGSTDFKARVFSAAVKGVDKKGAGGPYPEKSFGELYAEFSCGGWVKSVAFSPSGNVIAFSGHDSTVTFVTLPDGKPQVVLIKDLPLRDIIFLSENALVGVGHENNPTLFTSQGGSWKYDRKLDEAAAAAGAAKAGTAFDKFKNKVDTGSEKNETTLLTKHQNSVSKVVPFKTAGGKTTQFSTSGVDGRVIVWDTAKAQIIQNFEAHENRVSCLGVSADGVVLCTGSWDSLLKVWGHAYPGYKP